MTWFLFTIISPILNATVNYIDKYLIEKVVEGRGIGSLIIFSALMGLPVALLILIFVPDVFNISTKNALLIMLNGTFYIAWVLPYLYALEKDDASVVIPLFQLSSVFTSVFSLVFLGELLSWRQILGCLFIMIGALGISYEKNTGVGGKVKYGLKFSVLALVAISCVFIAVSSVIFKYVALKESFWVTSFWENLGIFISSLFLFGVASYRKHFLLILRRDRLRVFGLNLLNEALVAVARICLNYAILLVPIALVAFVDTGFQPFFVFAFGIFLSSFFPEYVNEKLENEIIFRKLFSILTMFLGTYFLLL